MIEGKQFSRRDFLKVTGATGAALILAGCGGKEKNELGFVDRITGTPLTDLPQIADAWRFEDSTLSLDLAKLPELENLGGAVRIEGEALPEDVLLVYGEDGNYYAFKNACTHAGRKIDPVAGTMMLECCSVSSSTFDYAGHVLSGPAEDPLTSYPLVVQGDFLEITF